MYNFNPYQNVQETDEWKNEVRNINAAETAYGEKQLAEKQRRQALRNYFNESDPQGYYFASMPTFATPNMEEFYRNNYNYLYSQYQTEQNKKMIGAGSFNPQTTSFNPSSYGQGFQTTGGVDTFTDWLDKYDWTGEYNKLPQNQTGTNTKYRFAPPTRWIGW